MKFIQKILSTAALFAVASAALAQGDPDVVRKTIDEGWNKGQASDLLKHLTQKIGPRLTGSPACNRAIDWAKGLFGKWGLTEIHIEKYNEYKVGFEKGPHQSGRMVSPVSKTFEFSSANWVVGTKGATRGPAIMLPTTPEGLEAIKDKLKGAWLMVKEPQGMRGIRGLDSKFDELGILGRIYPSTNEYVYGGGGPRPEYDPNKPKTPTISVRKSDFEAVEKVIQEGKSPVLEFNIESRFLGPIPLQNIVAEIPGTEKPDEYVYLLAHIDSWNAPGSQGAADNGTGTCAVLEAARILRVAGAKPKRTIRFLLVSGEEQGLLGSGNYVKQHADIMKKISAVLCEDSGGAWQAGVAGPSYMLVDLKRATYPLRNAFPNMPVGVREVASIRAGGGSDHASFARVGVPAFFMMKGGQFNYGRIWHTQHDRFEEVPPQNMKQMATTMAVIAYNLACADHMLAREAPATVK